MAALPLQALNNQKTVHLNTFSYFLESNETIYTLHGLVGPQFCLPKAMEIKSNKKLPLQQESVIQYQQYNNVGRVVAEMSVPQQCKIVQLLYCGSLFIQLMCCWNLAGFRFEGCSSNQEYTTLCNIPVLIASSYEAF